MRTLRSWRERIKAVARGFDEEAVAGALALVGAFEGGANTAAGRGDLALEWQRRNCKPKGVWQVVAAADNS